MIKWVMYMLCLYCTVRRAFRMLHAKRVFTRELVGITMPGMTYELQLILTERNRIGTSLDGEAIYMITRTPSGITRKFHCLGVFSTIEAIPAIRKAMDRYIRKVYGRIDVEYQLAPVYIVNCFTPVKRDVRKKFMPIVDAFQSIPGLTAVK